MSFDRVKLRQSRYQSPHYASPTSYERLRHEDGEYVMQTPPPEIRDNHEPNKDQRSIFHSFEVLGGHGQPRRWGIHWASPALMIFLFLAGTALAIGHHLYYQSLDDQEVTNVASDWDLPAVQNNQEWKIRFGTAFAFVVQAAFAMTVVCAYQHSIWTTVKGKALTIEGLDALFAADHEFLSFFNLDYLLRAKLPFLLAALAWIIPLSALVTPATLTVVPTTRETPTQMTVPTVNFSSVNPLSNFDSSALGSDYNTADNGITPYMSRLIAATASQLDILPMKAVAPNATYSLTFRGPSLQCSPPGPEVATVIYQTLNITHMLCDAGNGRGMATIYDTPLAWVAFPPPSHILGFVRDGVAINDSTQAANSPWNITAGFADMCIVGSNAVMTDFVNRISTGNVQCEGVTTLQADDLSPPYNNGRIWIWAQNNTYDCALTDTEYDVNFVAQDSGQRIDTAYRYTYTNDAPHGSYSVITNALANLLTGAVYGLEQGIASYKTRVSETAMFGALRANPVQERASAYGLAPQILPPEVTAMARNLSVGALVEELSRNITLSLFSATQVLSTNGTTASVTQTRPVNVYNYNRDTLLITYAVTWFLALIGLVIGLLQLVRNGVSHGTSFSSILLATRNHDLDRLTHGQSLGAVPMDRALARTRLRYGVLENSPAIDGVKRVGFGAPGQVSRLNKGDPYY